MAGLRAFISYSHRDRRLARKLKEGLIEYGFNVFLAHDDIEGSSEWARTILGCLKKSDLFLPLLTKNFPDSEWTDQETGFALATRKFIIPLKVDVIPYGFIGPVQALSFKSDDMDRSCKKICRIVWKRPEYREKFLDGIIRLFSESMSFDDAGDKAALVLEFNGYTRRQVKDVLLATLDNNQVRESFRAQRRLRTFLDRYSTRANATLVRKVRRAIE